MTNKKFILLLILMLVIPVFVFAADFLYGKKLDKEVEQRTQNMKNNSIIQLFLEQYPNAIFEVLPHGQSDAIFANEEREFYIDYIHETQQIYLYCIDRSDDLNLKTVFEETDGQKIRERILNKECQ